MQAAASFPSEFSAGEPAAEAGELAHQQRGAAAGTVQRHLAGKRIRKTTFSTVEKTRPLRCIAKGGVSSRQGRDWHMPLELQTFVSHRPLARLS